jgi:predicted DNA-binding protein (MmcQ/YjbR family)
MAPRTKSSNPLDRVRRIVKALDSTTEVRSWGAPTFRVNNKIFAMYASANDHHGYGRNAIWCMAGPGNQEFMVQARPDRFFRPPYVGPSGWIGIYLDGRVSWTEVAGLLEDAHRLRKEKNQRKPGRKR